jgi:hypothetical protein
MRLSEQMCVVFPGTWSEREAASLCGDMRIQDRAVIRVLIGRNPVWLGRGVALCSAQATKEIRAEKVKASSFLSSWIQEPVHPSESPPALSPKLPSRSPLLPSRRYGQCSRPFERHENAPVMQRQILDSEAEARGVSRATPTLQRFCLREYENSASNFRLEVGSESSFRNSMPASALKIAALAALCLVGQTDGFALSPAVNVALRGMSLFPAHGSSV